MCWECDNNESRDLINYWNGTVQTLAKYVHYDFFLLFIIFNGQI